MSPRLRKRCEVENEEGSHQGTEVKSPIMIYLTHTPAPPLHLAVASIWLYAGYCPPHRLERVLPSGTLEWVINLREDRFLCYDPGSLRPIGHQPGSIMVGPRCSVQVIDTEHQSEIMGVHLRSGGLRYLSQMPADEFADRDVPLDEIWKRFSADVRDALLAAPTPRAKLLTLERFLSARMSLARPQHPAVGEALRRLEPRENPLKQAELAAELGLSCRRFIQVFTASVGLTPKVYARIRRFQKALRCIHRASSFDAADVAFECGWYDQAHMIRDFKQFAGLTPAQYARLQGEFLGHVPVEERGQICPIPDAQPVAPSGR